MENNFIKEYADIIVYISFLMPGIFILLKLWENYNVLWPIIALVAGILTFNYCFVNKFKIKRPREDYQLGPSQPFMPSEQWVYENNSGGPRKVVPIPQEPYPRERFEFEPYPPTL